MRNSSEAPSIIGISPDLTDPGACKRHITKQLRKLGMHGPERETPSNPKDPIIILTGRIENITDLPPFLSSICSGCRLKKRRQCVGLSLQDVHDITLPESSLKITRYDVSPYTIGLARVYIRNGKGAFENIPQKLDFTYENETPGESETVKARLIYSGPVPKEFQKPGTVDTLMVEYLLDKEYRLRHTGKLMGALMTTLSRQLQEFEHYELQQEAVAIGSAYDRPRGDKKYMLSDRRVKENPNTFYAVGELERGRHSNKGHSSFSQN